VLERTLAQEANHRIKNDLQTAADLLLLAPSRRQRRAASTRRRRAFARSRPFTAC
jgi:two-component sensor histidine kinase